MNFCFSDIPDCKVCWFQDLMSGISFGYLLLKSFSCVTVAGCTHNVWHKMYREYNRSRSNLEVSIRKLKYLRKEPWNWFYMPIRTGWGNSLFSLTIFHVLPLTFQFFTVGRYSKKNNNLVWSNSFLNNDELANSESQRKDTQTKLNKRRL